MEPECSLLHSKVPATCPYPEPDQSNSCSQFCLLKNNFNIILPLKREFSKWSLSLRFSLQNTVRTSALSHMCYVHCLLHSTQFDHLNHIWRAVQIIKFFIILCSPLFWYPIPLRPKYSPRTLFANTLSLRSFLIVSNNVSQLYETIGYNVLEYILMVLLLDSKLEDKIFCTEWWQAFPYFNVILISFWMKSLFAKFVPKYLKPSTLSKELFSFFILWLSPALWSRDITMYLGLLATPSQISLLATSKASFL